MSSITDFSTGESEPYSPISCSDYDFLEIMCMDQYRVVLSLDLDGCLRSVVGTAQDLEVRSPNEYLKLKKDSGELHEVRIDCIRHVRVLSMPSRFSEHRFGLSC